MKIGVNYIIFCLFCDHSCKTSELLNITMEDGYVLYDLTNDHIGNCPKCKSNIEVTDIIS